MNDWEFIASPPASARINMQLDHDLFRKHETGVIGSVFRIYTWDRPCITYGYSQNPIADIDVGSIPDADEAVARRPTGGGIVYHDPGDFTYCLITGLDNPVLPRGIEDSCAFIHEVLAQALNNYGIAAGVVRKNSSAGEPQKTVEKFCFDTATRYELVDENGKKIAGSAQRRGKKTILQQGTIPFRHLESGFFELGDFSRTVCRLLAAALGG